MQEGGWSVVQTVGYRLCDSHEIFAAETAGTATILSASVIGVPVSTTHCISAAIMGVGASKRLSAVRWGVAGNMVVAWVMTIPLSALIAFGALVVLRAIFGGG